jgi:hypothetical protein
VYSSRMTWTGYYRGRLATKLCRLHRATRHRMPRAGPEKVAGWFPRQAGVQQFPIKGDKAVRASDPGPHGARRATYRRKLLVQRLSRRAAVVPRRQA